MLIAVIVSGGNYRSVWFSVKQRLTLANM